MDDNNAGFHHYHLRQIPKLFAVGGGESALLASRELPPLCLRLSDSDEAYSYHPGAHRIDIVAGTEAPLLYVLPGEQWQEFVSKPLIESANKATNRNESSILNADIDAEQLTRWQQVLQLLYAATARAID